jgi:hypothetical protein
MEYTEARHLLKKELKHLFTNAPAVYVISFKKNEPPYKIGLAYNLQTRLNSYRTTFIQFYVYYVFITTIDSLEDLESALHHNKRLEHNRIKFPKSIYDKRIKLSYSEWFMTDKRTIKKSFYDIFIPIINGYEFYESSKKRVVLKHMKVQHPLVVDGLVEFTKRGRRLKRMTQTVLVDGRKYGVTLGDSVFAKDEDSKGIIRTIKDGKASVLFEDGFQRKYSLDEIAMFV